MPIPPAAKRCAPPVALLLLAALAGCRTHPNPSPSTPPHARGEGLAQARALAHYATGLMLSEDAAARGQPPPPAALDAFLAAHRLDPASSAPAGAAARILSLENRVETFHLFSSHAPRAAAPAHAFYQLGLCAEWIGQPLAAINAHAAALKSPGLPESLRAPVLSALVRACMAAERDPRAFQILKREASANPARRGVTHALAEAWAREFSGSTNHARTVRAARFAATLAPTRDALVFAQCLEARALEQDGQTRAAEKILLRLIEPRDPAAAPAAVDLGVLHARAGNTNAVLKLQKSAAKNSLHGLAAAAAWNEWGDFSAAQKNLMDAYPIEKMDAFPEHPIFYLLYGNVLLEAENFTDAARLSRHALRRHPALPEMLNLYAYAMALNNESLKQAESAVRRALAHDFFNPAYLDTLGWVLYKQDRKDEALEVLRRAVFFAPDDPVIRAHLEEVLEKEP